MEFDLCPSVTLQTGTFNAVAAPAEMITAAVNTNKELQRFMFLFVSGNYSRLMSDISRVSTNFEVRRAFTVFQLLTILNESYHTIVLIEHDPTLYEGIEKSAVVPQVIRALKSAARDAMVILYTPAADFTFHTLARQADRVFVLSPVTPYGAATGRTWRARGNPGSRQQKTLEAFHGTHHYEQQDGSKGSRPAVVAGDTGTQER
jgi:hypothetical protein